MVWGENCGSRGACYFYKIGDYRHYMHGVTLGSQSISLLLAILTAYFVHKLFSKGGQFYEGESTDSEIKIGNGQIDKEVIPEKEKLNEQEDSRPIAQDNFIPY